MNSTLVLLVVALAASPLTMLVGTWRSRWTSYAAVSTTLAAFVAALWAWWKPGTGVDYEWAPTWGARIHFDLDGLGLMYSLLATGVGLAVVVYSSRYIPDHLHHEQRDPREIVRFYGFLLLFMGAMVGLVMAQDLLLIFLFWDLTAVASYFLIGFDSQRQDARISALMALMVTGISAVAFLIGTLMLKSEYGTLQLPELFVVVENSRFVAIATGLMLIAALAKSAQFPLHFWLPRAMAAPTPVSAYLHSAAMVAAGVFLIGRIYPLVEPSAFLLDMLTVVGIASIATGGLLALSRQHLKQLLAYSTISQYGYVVLMFGLGGESGVVAATFYVIAHAIAKSALFLTAGAVSEATGAYDLTDVGGQWRLLPALAAGSGMAAAALAALPLTIGFFKDELFFKAAHDHGRLFDVVAIIAAAMTFTYMARFWFGIFTGAPQGERRPLSNLLVAPVVALGTLAVIGGIWTRPFVDLAESASSATLLQETQIHLAYHLESTSENLMAAASIAIGASVFAMRRYWQPSRSVIGAIGVRIGPEHLYTTGLYRLNRLSDRIHWIEVRDLRSRVATVLIPAALLVGGSLIVSDVPQTLTRGSFRLSDMPLALMLAVVALASVTAAVPRDHFSMALALSGAGFGLAVVYSFLRAPDVALVAVLIETIFALLIFGFLALIPRDIDHAQVIPSDEPTSEMTQDAHRRRDAVLGVLAGGFAFFVAWGVLSKPASLEAVMQDHIRLTPAAHGQAVVTVILADFRGLDTMGEITVVGVAFLGIATLMRRTITR